MSPETQRTAIWRKGILRTRSEQEAFLIARRKSCIKIIKIQGSPRTSVSTPEGVLQFSARLRVEPAIISDSLPNPAPHEFRREKAVHIVKARVPQCPHITRV